MVRTKPQYTKSMSAYIRNNLCNAEARHFISTRRSHYVVQPRFSLSFMFAPEPKNLPAFRRRFRRDLERRYRDFHLEVQWLHVRPKTRTVHVITTSHMWFASFKLFMNHLLSDYGISASRMQDVGCIPLPDTMEFRRT
jgi:hypothetical protein